jgi:hypothetical protein
MNIYVFNSPEWNLDFETKPLAHEILSNPAIVWRNEKSLNDAIKTIQKIDRYEYVGEPTGPFNSGIRFVKVTGYSIKQLDDGQYRLEIIFKPTIYSDIKLNCAPITKLQSADWRSKWKPGQKVTIHNMWTGETKEETVHTADEDDCEAREVFRKLALTHADIDSLEDWKKMVNDIRKTLLDEDDEDED